jgi:hypothetical protein
MVMDHKKQSNAIPFWPFAFGRQIPGRACLSVSVLPCFFSRRKRMNAKANMFLGFFGVFWSAMTLSFDGTMFVPAAKQVVASHYYSTEGTVVSSQVTFDDDSEGGTTQGVDVRYTYRVGEREYTGTRYRYGNWNSTDSAWAHGVVAARPPGTKVRVFYKLGDPQDSVLATGLLGSDLFLFAFMTPFNAVMLLLWWTGWTQLRRSWFKPPAGGVKIITELRTTRARLTTWSPVGMALATTALLAFGSIFVVCPFGGGFHPSMSTMLVTWTAILCGGAVAGAWHAFRVLSGRYDLIIDELNGAIELPITQGRKSRCRLPFSSVQSVYVDRIQKPSGGGEQSSPKYAPTLNIQGATPATERLVEWFDAEKAGLFVEWLREKLPQRAAPSRPLAGKF